jgi:hypothetical protein
VIFMLVMVSNATGMEVGLLAGRHPGRVGHLFSPGGQRGPWMEMPYSLDTGDYGCWINGTEWNEAEWRALLMWAAMSGITPLWAVVHDCPGNRDETLRRWEQYEPVVRQFGFRRAFAVQDGMTFADVPDDDCIIFIGGSDKDDWKDNAIRPWCARFPGRVHVARVNGADRLLRCWHAGAVSVDGTGWFHKHNDKNGGQAAVLRKFLRETSQPNALRSVA